MTGPDEEEKTPTRKGADNVLFAGNRFYGVDLGRMFGPEDQVTLVGNTFINSPRGLDLNAKELIAIDNRIVNDPKRGRRIHKIRSGGATLPAYCSRCKSIFASANYSIRSPTAFFRGNKEVCPVCSNEDAQLSEGAFDLSNAFVRVISAPDFTYEMLARLSEILGEVKAGRLTALDAANKAKDVHPGLHKVLLQIARDPAIQTLIGLLALIATAWPIAKEISQAWSAPVELKPPAERRLSEPIQPAVNVSAGRNSSASADPAEKKSLLEPHGSQFKMNTRSAVNALRRRRIKQRRSRFGGARHGGPGCWCFGERGR